MIHPTQISELCYEDIKLEFEESIFKEFGPQSNSKCFTNEKRREYIEKLLNADVNKDLPKQIRGFSLGSDLQPWDQSQWKFHNKSGEKLHLWTKKTFSSSAKNLGIIRRIVVLEEFFDLIKSLHERPTKDGYNGQKKLFNMIKNRYACLPRDAVDKYITLWRRKATNGASSSNINSSNSNCNNSCKGNNEFNTTSNNIININCLAGNNNSDTVSCLIPPNLQAGLTTSSFIDNSNNNNQNNPLINLNPTTFFQQFLPGGVLNNLILPISAAASIAANNNNNNISSSNSTIISSSASSLQNNNCIFDATTYSNSDANNNSSGNANNFHPILTGLGNNIDTTNNQNGISQVNGDINNNENSLGIVNNNNSNKFSGISMVYQPSSYSYSNNFTCRSSDSTLNLNKSTISTSNNPDFTSTNTFLNSSDSPYSLTKESSLREQNSYYNDDGLTIKRLKMEEDSGTNTDNEEENISPSQAETSTTNVKTNGIKKPTDLDMAYNLFVRRVIDQTLDRTVTFCEQPKHIITGLETICANAFSTLDKSRHRIKIRGYLKACRRNSKKHNGKVSMKDTPSHMCSEKAYSLANEAMKKVECDVEKLKQINPMLDGSILHNEANLANFLKPPNLSIASFLSSAAQLNNNAGGVGTANNNNFTSSSSNPYLDYMESALISSHIDSNTNSNTSNNSISVGRLNGSMLLSNPIPNQNLSWGIPTTQTDSLLGANNPSINNSGFLDQFPNMFNGFLSGFGNGESLLTPLMNLCTESALHPPPAHTNTQNPAYLHNLMSCSQNLLYPTATTALLEKMMSNNSITPELASQMLINRQASQEAINFMRITARYLLTRSVMYETFLHTSAAAFNPTDAPSLLATQITDANFDGEMIPSQDETPSDLQVHQQCSSNSPPCGSNSPASTLDNHLARCKQEELINITNLTGSPTESANINSAIIH